MVISSFKESITRLLSNVNRQMKIWPTRGGAGGTMTPGPMVGLFFGSPMVGDHIIFRTKLQHFLHLFWTLQNYTSVTFELSPGPRSALGASK